MSSGWQNVYDKNSTRKNFFGIDYKKFWNFIDISTYEFILSKKYNMILSDEFLSRIKKFLIKALQLLQNSLQSELYLTEDVILKRFLTNVLEYIKLEKLYICYFQQSKMIKADDSTMNTIASQTETKISKSLFRVFILITDLHRIYNNPVKIGIKPSDINITIRELIRFFQENFSSVISSISLIPQNNKNLYKDELDVIEVIEVALKEFEQIEDHKSYIRVIKSVNSLLPTKSNTSNNASMAESTKSLMKFNTPTKFKPHEEDSDNCRLSLRSVVSTSSKLSSHEYYKATKFTSSFSMNNNDVNIGWDNRYDDSVNNFEDIGNEVNNEKNRLRNFGVPSLRNSANYGRLMANLKQHEDKEGIKKEKSGMDRNAFFQGEINMKRNTVIIPPKALPNSREGNVIMVGNYNVLDLLDIDVDNSGQLNMKVNEDKQKILDEMRRREEEKIRQEEEKKRQQEELKKKKEEDEAGLKENEEDDDIEINSDINDASFKSTIRKLKDKGRKKIVLDEEIEFKGIKQTINEDNAHIQEINAYQFYEKVTLDEYKKPDRHYLAETERMFERPSVIVPDELLDYCFVEDPISKQRKDFLTKIYGNNLEKKNQQEVYTTPDIRMINNNQNLKPDILDTLIKELEYKKISHIIKQVDCRSSIEYFLGQEMNHMKQIDMTILQRKQKTMERWDIIRSYFRLRLIWKKLTKKSLKGTIDVKSRFKSGKILSAFDNGLENCVIQSTLYSKAHKKSVEVFAMGRRMKFKTEYDFIRNFDKIPKPQGSNNEIFNTETFNESDMH